MRFRFLRSGGLAAAAAISAVIWVGCGEASDDSNPGQPSKSEAGSEGGTGGGGGSAGGKDASVDATVGGASGHAGSGGGAGGTAGSAGAAGSVGGAAGGIPGNFVPECPSTCEPIPGASYTSVATLGDHVDHPPPLHGDVNPKMRGWAPCDVVGCGENGSVLGFVTYSLQDLDPGAPRFHRLFNPPKVPPFVRNYRSYDWNWACGKDGCRGDLITSTKWLVHFVGLQTTPGEILGVPACQKPFQPPYAARVIYADADTVTIRYAPGDGVVSPGQNWGYAVHIVGLCVDPPLRARYEADDLAGRNQLPALTDDQPIGRACGQQTLLGIRDTGTQMDPRAEPDWWSGHP